MCGFIHIQNCLNLDCFECNCDPIGSIPGSVCDKLTGECVWYFYFIFIQFLLPAKKKTFFFKLKSKISNGIGGTRCDICLPGFYNFNRVTGSCLPCGCNEAG